MSYFSESVLRMYCEKILPFTKHFLGEIFFAD
jgi:hypothetical protein